MGWKIAVTFLFHIAGLVLLLLPNQMQGQVITKLLGVPLRTLDVTGIVLIVMGSVLLNIYLFTSLRKQINPATPEDENGKTNNGVN